MLSADTVVMWLWGLLGWLVASGFAALLHHRFRRARPRVAPEVAGFIARFDALLAAEHPGARFVTMLPDQFACLLEVDGQETPVSLHDAFRHQQASPAGFGAYVARLVDDIREVGLDRIEDLDLASAATLLLPQVRSRDWLEQKGCFGDSGLVYRGLNDELATVYVVDDPQCMVFVCRAHLKRWRKSEDEIHNLALSNLARLDPARLDELKEATEPLRVEVGDGYDAARVLLLDEQDDLLVAIPDRDLLWVGSEQQVDVESLMADTEAIARQAPHPVSPHVFRVREGGLEAVRGDSRR